MAVTTFARPQVSGFSPMNTELVKVATLTTDPDNVRVHDERNIAAVAASLKRFGQQKPIVVNPAGRVVAGNGTLEAAQSLGWEKIAVVRTPLEGSEATAFSIADNRTAELADWDFEGLASQLQGLVDSDFDMDALGWAEHELEPLLQADWSPPPAGEMLGADGGTGAAPIKLTAEQREVVDRAIAKVRQDKGDDSISEGACIECICAAYLEAP